MYGNIGLALRSYNELIAFRFEILGSYIDEIEVVAYGEIDKNDVQLSPREAI